MKEKVNRNGKLILVFSAILFVPMLYPQTISKAQDKLAVEDSSTQDKIDKINSEKGKVLDSALNVASDLPEMSSRLTRVIKTKKHVEIKTKIIKPTVVLQYHGEVFEPDSITAYKGYLIVHLDNLIKPVDTVEIMPINIPASTPSEPSSKPPIKKQNFFQRLFKHKTN